MNRRGIIILLAGANFLLLITLILASWRLPAAHAQGVPLGSSYLMVAGEIRNGSDALYVIDLANRRMHVLVPNLDRNARRLVHRDYRSLEQDFRRGG